jgi:hypothetical protein
LAFVFALLCLPELNLPLNGDEAKTYLEHISSTPSQLLFQYTGPNQHTLFSILSNASMRIFGENEAAFRMPVFLAAILSIFLIHHLGQSLWNRRTATIASLLIMGSHHHFFWAQHGRGYAFTEMLALILVLGAILLLEDKSFNRGTWVLIFSGFALCITLPSNAYFIPGCGLAFLFVLYESRNPAIYVSWSHLGKKLSPFFFLAILLSGYFFIIYDDLVIGIQTYKNYLEQFREVRSDLAQPWGIWFYLPVIYGAWTLNRTQRGFFLILLGTPALLIILSGMIGPPRSYVYALPFLILLAALGIDRGIAFLSRFMPRYFDKALPVTLGLVFLIPSAFSHIQNYSNNKGIKYSTMEESRGALRYLKNQTTEHDLVVISFDDMALRRSLEPLVAEKMLRIFKDGQLDGIIFLGHRDTPIDRIASVAGWPTSTLPVSLMRVIADIGKLRIYRMNVNSTPLFPLTKDTNFSQQWQKPPHPTVSGTETNAHRFLGKQSLQIKKNYKENTLILSSLVYSFPSQGGNFLLHAYAEKYPQKSRAGILGNKKNRGAFPLNYLFGVYREEGNNLAWERIHPFFMFRHAKHKKSFKWRITYMLIPLNAGLNKIQQALMLKDETSYFDGIHGYLLAPIVEQ